MLKQIEGSRAVAEAVARITAAALETITVARSETVAFHERALEIAKAMPTTYVVSGPGVTTVYLDIDDATGEPVPESAEMVASLLNPDAHRERLFQDRLSRQEKGAEIFGYVTELREKGWTVKAQIQEDGTGIQAIITATGQTETVATTLAQLRTAATSAVDLTP